MGRWAQRKRSGGSPTSENFIISATITDPFTITATYQGPVDFNQFDPITFNTDPSAQSADSVDQISSRSILITFLNNLTGDTELLYNGEVPGITTPQTVLYS
jgi:hypothetical protein